MKTLILETRAIAPVALEQASASIIGLLKERGWDVTKLNIDDMNVAGCIGCWGCWVKTPGECVLADDGRLIAESVIRSDLAVFITSISFGGYSSIVKRAIDRLLPLASPFFCTVNGETHHKQRYDKYPSLLGVGVSWEQDQKSGDIFRRLISRNAINLRAPFHCAVVIEDNDTKAHRAEAEKFLGEVEVLG